MRERIYELASSKEGHFTTADAAEAGYSPQLLYYYLRLGCITRVRRGVYRIVHFPPGEQEDLVTVWLWTERAGVFSHETALALHGLSDVLPARVHVTLPYSWSSRRLRVPKAVVLYFADVVELERGWSGSVPVTTPKRTLEDCVAAHASPEMIEKALRDALVRGLLLGLRQTTLRELSRTPGDQDEASEVRVPGRFQTSDRAASSDELDKRCRLRTSPADPGVRPFRRPRGPGDGQHRDPEGWPGPRVPVSFPDCGRSFTRDEL